MLGAGDAGKKQKSEANKDCNSAHRSNCKAGVERVKKTKHRHKGTEDAEKHREKIYEARTDCCGDGRWNTPLRSAPNRWRHGAPRGEGRR